MTGSFSRKLKLIFNLTAITFISYFLATTFFFVWLAKHDTLPETLKRTSDSQLLPNKKNKLSDFTIIESRNLLAVKNVRNAPSKSGSGNTANNLPVSKRGFKLLGTVFSDNSDNNRAVILFENSQSIYKNGELVGGWEIIKIKRRAIVLAKDAEKEILFVDEIDPALTAGTATSKKVISRGYAQRQLGNIEKLASSIAVIPKKVNGTTGLAVQSIQKRSFLHDMGLRKNDLLVRANDQSFRTLGDITSLMTMLEDESISLEILRNGKRQTLTYKLVK